MCRHKHYKRLCALVTLLATEIHWVFITPGVAKTVATSVATRASLYASLYRDAHSDAYSDAAEPYIATVIARSERKIFWFNALPPINHIECFICVFTFEKKCKGKYRPKIVTHKTI
ncbi:hypothetical protein DD606_25100 [Enterobacter cloacae complex sp. GF14B]|nr:hypothetical protein DD606_25100 [Enterobacter cloacae complex sp. GF14B]